MRTAEELQAENTNLRCFLWLLAKEAGGRVTIPKAALEDFRPAHSRVNFWIEFASGNYWIDAQTECPNCHDANSCGDYEGPACHVCGGEGFVSISGEPK